MPVLITEEYMNEVVFSRKDFATLMHKFYLQVKHGDEEHQKWLRDETLKFIHDETIKEAVAAHHEYLKQKVKK